MEIGRVGIWSGLLRRADAETAVGGAREIERLGFPAAWFSSGRSGQLDRARELLAGTESLVLGTSILNIYTEPDPAATAAAFAEMDSRYPDRLLLGIGVGHPEVVDRKQPGLYRRPLSAIAEYLDGLDAARPPVPREKRAVAALGPKMLDLAAARSAGALPYLTIPAHTRQARERMGPDALLAVELMVVLEAGAESARAIARERLAGYLGMSNYRSSFIRQGFSEADIEGGGSDSFVDEMVTWGDERQVRTRVEEHLAAGADHVAVQVLAADDATAFPVEGWRRLAAVLL